MGGDFGEHRFQIESENTECVCACCNGEMKLCKNTEREIHTELHELLVSVGNR